MSISLAELDQQIAEGIIRAQTHPTLPLTIYNYTDRCQYDNLWTPLAEQCRGLIMDGETVIARPFRKFFNDTEHEDGEIPWHIPCEITEKLDGSLLILFFYAGEWRTATRGSFVSEQSVRGMEILRKSVELDALWPHITYLFEVIYPENRIVVNYGEREECILLGMVSRDTGVELPLRNAPTILKVVRRLDFASDVRKLRSIIKDDEEGYVVRFANGFRMKVKGQRYMELHRAISGLSSRMIWEHLSQAKPLDDLLSMIPDEYGDWVRREVSDQSAQFQRLMKRGLDAASAVADLPTRKEQAMAIKERFPDVSSLAFANLDGKDATQSAWKMAYPPLRTPVSAALLEVAE